MENLADRQTNELLQQMRIQAEADQNHLYKYHTKQGQDIPADTDTSRTGTFRIRLALAGVLLLTILLLDQKEKSVAGISMDQILTYVTSVDYEACLENWVETAVNDSQVLW